MAGGTEVSITEAAHRLSFTWRRTWDAVLSGRLRGRKVNGRWLVDSGDVDRFVREREAANASEAQHESVSAL